MPEGVRLREQFLKRMAGLFGNFLNGTMTPRLGAFSVVDAFAIVRFPASSVMTVTVKVPLSINTNRVHLNPPSVNQCRLL